MERRFYDIHYHLFDLSHPNLLAFLLHEDLISKNLVVRIMKRLPVITNFLPLGILRLFPVKIAEMLRTYLRNDAGNLMNLLSVMESSIEYHFLYVEYFLLKEKLYFGLSDRFRYNKIVICPQLIDFGFKNLNNKDCFYNLPPGKPVTSQVVDLFNASYFYYNYELIRHPDKSGRLEIIPSDAGKENKLFEIYPFLGLNTRNYDLQEIAALFDKYFRGYENDRSPEERRAKLFRKLGTTKIDLADMIFHRFDSEKSDFYTYLFAGIKLYPPLSFDPWPEENPRELEKVKFLYSECIRKKLPVTVHCSDGGFIASPDSAKYTNPAVRWQNVIGRSEFKQLRINFAHLGKESGNKTEWFETIMSFIAGNRNIYSDCSCQTPSTKDYERINIIMDQFTESNILFGSDFVINLLWSRSYNDYLNNFINTPYLDEGRKKKLCEVNPERFLFG